MQTLGLVSKEDLKGLNSEIKENKEEWLNSIRRYDDLSIDEVW